MHTLFILQFFINKVDTELLLLSLYILFISHLQFFIYLINLLKRIINKFKHLHILLISKEHLNKVTEYIDSGVKKRSYFVGPRLFDNVSKKMKIYKEEIFGPVLVIDRVSSYEEALSLTNK